MGDVPRCTWGRKYLLRKSVCRLTGHMKTLKNAHNTGFLRLARPGSAGRVVSVWGEKVGRAAPALCLSLLNSPLVNRVLGHSSWSAKPGSTDGAARYGRVNSFRMRRHFLLMRARCARDSSYRRGAVA